MRAVCHHITDHVTLRLIPYTAKVMCRKTASGHRLTRLPRGWRLLCLGRGRGAADEEREQGCGAAGSFRGHDCRELVVCTTIYPPIGRRITHTGVGYYLPAVLSENIHYFTNTVEVLQQCNIFSISLFLYSSTQFIYITLSFINLSAGTSISKVLRISESTPRNLQNFAKFTKFVKLEKIIKIIKLAMYTMCVKS